jgi:hypothetical protein
MRIDPELTDQAVWVPTVDLNAVELVSKRLGTITTTPSGPHPKSGPAPLTEKVLVPYVTSTEAQVHVLLADGPCPRHSSRQRASQNARRRNERD